MRDVCKVPPSRCQVALPSVAQLPSEMHCDLVYHHLLSLVYNISTTLCDSTSVPFEQNGSLNGLSCTVSTGSDENFRLAAFPAAPNQVKVKA